MGSIFSSLSGEAGTISGYISALFTACLAVVFGIRWFAYTHASDDTDMKKARRQLWTAAIGAIGFFAITAIITTLKTLQ